MSRQASPSLWIFHSRWCLMWLFLSSWFFFSPPLQSQVVISRAAPPPPPLLLPHTGPCDVWSRARGGQPDIQPSLWCPSLRVPCTLAPLLWGLKEIMQPGGLWKPSSIEQRLKTGGTIPLTHTLPLSGKNLKSTYCSQKKKSIDKKRKGKINIPVLTLVSSSCY